MRPLATITFKNIVTILRKQFWPRFYALWPTVQGWPLLFFLLYFNDEYFSLHGLRYAIFREVPNIYFSVTGISENQYSDKDTRGTTGEQAFIRARSRSSFLLHAVYSSTRPTSCVASIARGGWESIF